MKKMFIGLFVVLWFCVTFINVFFNIDQFKHQFSVETQPATPWYWEVCNYLVFQQFHTIFGLGSNKVTRFYHWQEPVFFDATQLDIEKCLVVAKDSLAADYSTTGLFRNLLESIQSLRGVVVRFVSDKPIQYGFAWKHDEGYMVKMCSVLCPAGDLQFLFIKGGDALFVAFDTDGSQVQVLLESPKNKLIDRDDDRFRSVRKM